MVLPAIHSWTSSDILTVIPPRILLSIVYGILAGILPGTLSKTRSMIEAVLFLRNENRRAKVTSTGNGFHWRFSAYGIVALH